MSKRQNQGILILLVSILLIAGNVRAQGTSVPVALVIDGNIWTWAEDTGKLHQITTRGYIHDLAVSPDGKLVAYRAYADIAREMLATEGGTDEWFYPEDIFVLDTTAGTETQLTEQDSSARYIGSSLESGMLRSAPVWSPAGKKLAWVNINYPFQSEKWPQLWRYDFEATEKPLYRTAFSSNSIPQLQQPPPIAWTQAGILITNAITSADSPNSADTAFLLMDFENHHSRDFIVHNKADKVMVHSMPIEYDGKTYLGVWYSNGDWELIDFSTLEAQPVAGIPEVFNPTLPATSYAMQVHLDSSLSNWGQIVPAHEGEPGEKVELALQPLDAIHPSPDGKAFAFIEGFSDGGLIYITVWRDGQRQAIVIPEEKQLTEFVWGPTAWRIRSGV
ncbi:MAG: hypothetical protein ABI690_16440 [Chloroflexota bacterium]